MVNKETQTASGTRDFSLKPGAVSYYYLTTEHQAAALRELCHHIPTQSPHFIMLLSDVASLVDLLENTWTKPFALGISKR